MPALPECQSSRRPPESFTLTNDARKGRVLAGIFWDVGFLAESSAKTCDRHWALQRSAGSRRADRPPPEVDRRHTRPLERQFARRWVWLLVGGARARLDEVTILGKLSLCTRHNRKVCNLTWERRSREKVVGSSVGRSVACAPRFAIARADPLTDDSRCVRGSAVEDILLKSYRAGGFRRLSACALRVCQSASGGAPHRLLFASPAAGPSG
jgi:hypothetical protein